MDERFRKTALEVTMKIGMVVNNLEVSGGYQKLVIRLSQSLTKKGHKVTIYSPAVNKKDCYPEDIKTLNIVTDKKLADLPSLKEQMIALAKYLDPSEELLIIHDPDCLDTLNHYDKGAFPKVIWMLNNQLPDTFMSFKDCLKISLKRTGDNNPYARIKVAIEDSLALKKLRSTANKVDAFATYDTFNKKLVETKLGRPAKVVYAGADLDEFVKVKRVSRQDNLTQIKLLSVGVAFPHRRYEDLIKALPLLKKRGLKPMLTIVGRHDLHQEYADSLKKLVKNLKLQQEVTFVEYAPQKQLMNLYADCDVFLFVNDGFTWGISVFEAVAAKVPVVITDNIGASDLITNEQTGWVVSPRSPQEIAVAVNKIATNPSQVNTTVGVAYSQVAEMLTWDAYAGRLLSTLK